MGVEAALARVPALDVAVGEQHAAAHSALHRVLRKRTYGDPGTLAVAEEEGTIVLHAASLDRYAALLKRRPTLRGEAVVDGEGVFNVKMLDGAAAKRSHGGSARQSVWAKSEGASCLSRTQMMLGPNSTSAKMVNNTDCLFGKKVDKFFAFVCRHIRANITKACSA
jgi:hypothetical protein